MRFVTPTIDLSDPDSRAERKCMFVCIESIAQSHRTTEKHTKTSRVLYTVIAFDIWIANFGKGGRDTGIGR